MVTTGSGTVGYGQDAPCGGGRQGHGRSPGDLALRVVLTLAVLGAATVGAAVLAFVALVVWQGCFISCDVPDPEPGLGLLAATAAVLAMVAGAWVVFRIWRMQPPTVRAWAWLLGGGVAAYLWFVAVAVGADAWTDATCTDMVRVSEDYAYPSCEVAAGFWVVAWAGSSVLLGAAGVRALRARRASV